jgi:hypothetical protein
MRLKEYLFAAVTIITVIVLTLITCNIYNYVKSGKRIICENLSSTLKEDHKILKVRIIQENKPAYRLVISEQLPLGRENKIVDRPGFTGDIFQIQSISMNIEKLGLAQDCYINNKRISLFLRVFSPFFKDKMLDISDIGEVPPAYRRKDVLYVIQKYTWKKIWSYVLATSNKEPLNVYNIILDLENISGYKEQEYLIFLSQDGQMHIKYPFNTNISPARRR